MEDHSKIPRDGCQRVGVIGAGSMGSGIAVAFANAGVPVDLLDVPGPANRRNQRSEDAIARYLKPEQSLDSTPLSRIRPGNTEDDLCRLRNADWVIEAVSEDLAVKHRLYARLAPFLKPDAVLSSNTSTLLRCDLVGPLAPDLARRFVISHFFNPPHRMTLMELIGPLDAPATDFTRKIAQETLSKTVVVCRDTPGFIANRIGCAWIAIAVQEAARLGVNIEQADAVNSALGSPRTGVFGLLDLIGIDLVPAIWGSLSAALPPDDVIGTIDLPSKVMIRELIKAGHFGRKTGGGFYRMGRYGQCEVAKLSQTSISYVPSNPALPGDLPGAGQALDPLLTDGSVIGAYARAVLGRLLRYVSACERDIAYLHDDINICMTLGYGWREGPLALASSLSPAAKKALNIGPGSCHSRMI